MVINCVNNSWWYFNFIVVSHYFLKCFTTNFVSYYVLWSGLFEEINVGIVQNGRRNWLVLFNGTYSCLNKTMQWRVQDFPESWDANSKSEGTKQLFSHIFAETALKWKQVDWEWGAHPWYPILDPPLHGICTSGPLLKKKIILMDPKSVCEYKFTN